MIKFFGKLNQNIQEAAKQEGSKGNQLIKDISFYLKIVENLLQQNLKELIDILLSKATKYKDEITLLKNIMEEIQRILFPNTGYITINGKIRVKKQQIEEEEKD